jgi:hypothetical protein
LFLLAGIGGSAPKLGLQGVDFAGLEHQGIRIEAAVTQATIPAKEAPENAKIPLPVKQIVLGRLITENVPVYDRTVWIVSYDATSLPAPGGPVNDDGTSGASGVYAPADYMIAFVDAETGEFLFSVRVNHAK